MNQSELEANIHVTGAKRGKTSATKLAFSFNWFWFYFFLVEKVTRDFFNQSQSEVKQNKGKTLITFDAKLQTPR